MAKKRRVNVREKIMRLLDKKQLQYWTVDSLVELNLPPKQIGNALYHMKQLKIIKDSGKKDGAKTVWTWHGSPPDSVFIDPIEKPEAGVTYQDVGKAVVILLRKQDAQIAHDTEVIKGLTQRVADLQVKNTELAEKLNRATEGRLSVKEIAEMSRRSSLQ